MRPVIPQPRARGRRRGRQSLTPHPQLLLPRTRHLVVPPAHAVLPSHRLTGGAGPVGMASLVHGGGGASGSGSRGDSGGVDGQARAFAHLLRQLLPVVLSGGLPGVAAPPNSDASDEESAPLIPPSTTSSSSTNPAASTTSRESPPRWWFSPFKRLHRAAHHESAPRIPPPATSPSSTDLGSASTSRVAAVPPSAARGSPFKRAPNESESLMAPSAISGSSSPIRNPPVLAIPPSASQRLLPWPFGTLRHAAPNMFDAWTARRRNLGADVEMTGSAQDQHPPVPVPHPTSATFIVRAAGQETVVHIPIDERLVASFCTFQQTLMSESDHPPISESTADLEGSTDKMKMFRGLLVAYVFFALPLVLFFFPRYVKGDDHEALKTLLDSNEVSIGKFIILGLFVIHVSVGLLAVLLAHIAKGSKATAVVGFFTLSIIISVLAFMDYILLKTLPDETTYLLIFVAHFIVMTMVICWLWFIFVWPCCCCKDDTSDNLLGSRGRPPV